MPQKFEPLATETEQVASQVVDLSFPVHKKLGPGLLESVYEICLCHEFAQQRIPFQRLLYAFVSFVPWW